ncbi:MAG: dephospho-CoA kinase, partial [Candidatus Omnitrophota bacterium]
IVFKDKTRRNLNMLCRIIHPKTIRCIKDAVKASKKKLVVVDAPLLIETGLHTFVDRIVVVAAARKRREKFCKMKGMNESQFCKRDALQLPTKEKFKYADFIIMNNMSKEKLKKEVCGICQTLKRR